jgi:hypothetical protein
MNPYLMKNKPDLEGEGPLWTAYLQINNSWKDTEYVYCHKY